MLLQALDELKLPQASENGYPTLEERRAKAIEAFRDTSANPVLAGGTLGWSSYVYDSRQPQRQTDVRLGSAREIQDRLLAGR